MRDDHDFMSKFPEVFGKMPFKATETNMMFGFQCGPGWLPVIHEVTKKISCIVLEQQLDDFRIVVVKQKFGELRVHTENKTSAIHDVIIDAVGRCSAICEVCGEPGELKDCGLIAVLCAKHRENPRA